MTLGEVRVTIWHALLPRLTKTIRARVYEFSTLAVNNRVPGPHTGARKERRHPFWT